MFTSRVCSRVSRASWCRAKLFGIMAAGRPTVFIGHPESELARVLDEHDAGYCIRQGDVDGLVERLRSMADDRDGTEAMGDRAREALALAYGRHQACEAWRELLEGLVPSAHAAATAESRTSSPADS